MGNSEEPIKNVICCWRCMRHANRTMRKYFKRLLSKKVRREYKRKKGTDDNQGE